MTKVKSNPPAAVADESAEALLNKINVLENDVVTYKAQLEGYHVENGELKSANESLVAEKEAHKSEVESLKKEIELLLKDDGAAAKEKKTGVGDVFTLREKKYKLLVAAAIIPGLGRRTALEILADEEAQQKLVDINSGVIAEVV